jgi:MFS family permease
MVAAYTPENRSGTALGALSAAVYSGSMAGTFLGGIFAEYFGYRPAFLASGMLLALAEMFVFFGAKENFVKPVNLPPEKGKKPPKAFADLLHVWPIMVLIAAMGLARQFETSFFPLLIQQMLGTLQGAAFWTGTLSAISALAGFLAGIVFGRLSDHFQPPRIAQAAAIGAGLFMLVHGTVQTFLFLALARSGMIFCAGGLAPLFQIWLAKETPPEKHGAVFGWSATASSAGWFLAPLFSGLAASGFGIRSIYFFGAVLFVGLVPLISWVAKKLAGDDELKPG